MITEHLRIIENKRWSVLEMLMKTIRIRKMENNRSLVLEALEFKIKDFKINKDRLVLEIEDLNNS